MHTNDNQSSRRIAQRAPRAGLGSYVCFGWAVAEISTDDIGLIAREVEAG